MVDFDDLTKDLWVPPADLASKNIVEICDEIVALRAKLEIAEKALANAKGTLDMIAGQHLRGEMEPETVDDGDYEGAYDEIVRVARTGARAAAAALNMIRSSTPVPISILNPKKGLTAMTPFDMLVQMKTVAKADVWLYSTHYGNGKLWTASFEIDTELVKLKLIASDHQTPEEAICVLFGRWQSTYALGVPAAAPPQLEAPAALAEG